jgi:anti-sigma regulatory factor (Ser/Thr protein kinase)
VKQGLQYVDQSNDRLTLPSDPSGVAPVSVLLASLVEEVDGGDNRNSIELSLEEGLANAILHGNLGIDSPTSEMEFDEIENIVKNRISISPYKDRVVRVDFSFDKQTASFKISDMGDGFDWQSKLATDQVGNDMPGGRGIKILETLASSFEYNQKGNELTVRFDL